jgi:rhomboid protease GluP
MKRSAPWVCWITILVCVVNFLLCQFSYSSLNTVEREILYGAYYKAMLMAGEPWRLISGSFVHGSWMHLFMNMYSLYVLGFPMEQRYGHARFAAVLFGSSFCGFLFYYIIGDSTVCVGLSGGLYGLLAVYLVLLLHSRLFAQPQMRNQFMMMLVLNLLINLLPNIAWQVHLGGFLAGLLAGLILEEKDNPLLRRNTVLALAALVIVLGVLAFRVQWDSSYPMYYGTDLKILQIEAEHGLAEHAARVQENLLTLYGY